MNLAWFIYNCQTILISNRLNAFLEGFYDIIPKRLISIFNEQELELLISGLPNVDIEDLKANTEYHKYQANSIQVSQMGGEKNDDLHKNFLNFYSISLLSLSIEICADSMVLACASQFRSSWSCKVPTIRYWYIEGAATRLWCARRHEWCTKIPDTSWWSFDGAPSICTYLVRSLGRQFNRE